MNNLSTKLPEPEINYRRDPRCLHRDKPTSAKVQLGEGANKPSTAPHSNLSLSIFYTTTDVGLCLSVECAASSWSLQSEGVLPLDQTDLEWMVEIWGSLLLCMDVQCEMV